MALDPAFLNKGPVESDADYAARLKVKLEEVDKDYSREVAERMKAQQDLGLKHDEVTDQSRATKNWKTVTAVAAVLLLLLAGMFGVVWFQNNNDAKVADAEKARLKGEIVRLSGELKEKSDRIAALEKQKSETVTIAGITAKQCMAEAEALVAKSCQGKTHTVTKTKMVFKDRMVTAPPHVPQGIVRDPQGISRPGPAGEAIWLWHAHNATAAAPQTCVIESGEGLGLPPYCAGYKVLGRNAQETKPEWLVRAAKLVRPTDVSRPTDTGLYQQPASKQPL